MERSADPCQKPARSAQARNALSVSATHGRLAHPPTSLVPAAASAERSIHRARLFFWDALSITLLTPRTRR